MYCFVILAFSSAGFLVAPGFVYFGHSVTEPTIREASGSICKAFIQGCGHKISKVPALANKYNTGKTKSSPRASVGLRIIFFPSPKRAFTILFQQLEYSSFV